MSVEKISKRSPRAGLELGTARSVGQRLTHWATGTPSGVGGYIDNNFCSFLFAMSQAALLKWDLRFKKNDVLLY